MVCALWGGVGTQDHAPLPKLMAAGVHFGRTHPGESCTDVSSVKAGVGRRQECPCVCREGDRVLAQVRTVARQDGSVVSLGLCHSSSGQQDKCEGLNNIAAWEQRQKGGKKAVVQLHWRLKSPDRFRAGKRLHPVLFKYRAVLRGFGARPFPCLKEYPFRDTGRQSGVPLFGLHSANRNMFWPLQGLNRC